MVIKYIALAVSILFMIALMGWIARQCWIDSRNDFKMAFSSLKDHFKKKKAD